MRSFGIIVVYYITFVIIYMCGCVSLQHFLVFIITFNSILLYIIGKFVNFTLLFNNKAVHIIIIILYKP